MVFSKLDRGGLGLIKFDKGGSRGIKMRGKFCEVLVSDVLSENPIGLECRGAAGHPRDSQTFMVSANPVLCPGQQSYFNMFEAHIGDSLIDLTSVHFSNYLKKVEKSYKGEGEDWIFRIYAVKEA